MRSRVLSWLLAFGSWCLGGGLVSEVLAEEEKGFVAHEWGTFTTLHDASGTQLPWYQRVDQLQGLPAFVAMPSTFSKAGIPNGFKVRMETPVIYFYTDARQKVAVEVAMRNGRIAEVFPAPSEYLNAHQWNQGERFPMSMDFPRWNDLEIIPVGEAEGVKLPEDPNDPNNHYFEARSVPQAALVRGKSAALDEKEPVAVYEKFLFYRGAGDEFRGLLPSVKDGMVRMENRDKDRKYRHLWLVRRTADGLKWKKLSALLKCPVAGENPTVSVSLDELEGGSRDEEAHDSLKESIREGLVESGLFPDEAAAMLATWDEHWLDEPGLRVFSIVPERTLEELLPLRMSPEPTELKRVFVHRAELVESSQFEKLEKALSGTKSPTEIKEQIEGLQLGRFSNGVLEVVAKAIGRKAEQRARSNGLEVLERIELAEKLRHE